LKLRRFGEAGSSPAWALAANESCASDDNYLRGYLLTCTFCVHLEAALSGRYDHGAVGTDEFADKQRRSGLP